MSYKHALDKAWDDLDIISRREKFSLRFLLDNYEIDVNSRSIYSQSCNTPPKDFISILLLHYLLTKLRFGELPKVTGDWITFKELGEEDFYYPVYKKRTIDVIYRKFSSNPDAFLALIPRFNGTRSNIGDIGVILEPFDRVPILISIWKGDEELSPSVNILFDRSITQIFPTEDVVVLTETLVHSL